ncbi:MAG: YesL family protein, partial [Acholeplasmataceae bacterium]
MKEFLYKAADMMYASFLFLLTTFFTIGIGFGASLTAMLRVSYQVYNEKEPNPVTKIYFRSFKESFIESSVLYLLMLTIGIPLFLSWHYALNNNIAWLIVVLLVCSYQWLIVFIYGFNTISLFK